METSMLYTAAVFLCLVEPQRMSVCRSALAEILNRLVRARSLVPALLLSLGSSPIHVFAQAVVEQSWIDQRCMIRRLSNEHYKACLEKLVEGLPNLDPTRRELFGEFYDPKEYVRCRLRLARNQTDCEKYVLRRREWLEYWPKGATRITWPEPPKQSVYRRGMTSKQYWQALCDTQAGEFIYKTARDVEGFLLVRLRGMETDIAMKDRYVIEDAYGLPEFYSSRRERRPGTLFIDRSPQTYWYVEATISGNSGHPTHVRHEADLARISELLRVKPNDKFSEADASRIVEISEFSSRYGVTWRGIRREHDIALGISGGELAVVDLKTGETLALRRGFALDPFALRDQRTQRWWLGAAGCPVMRRDFASLRDFIRRVLIPKGI
jgi:hypothetical protein